MKVKFTYFLLQQPWARVLRVLLFSREPRSLRELAELSGVSIAGVQDVMRRFVEGDLVHSSPVGNKIFFSLDLDKEEKQSLMLLFEQHTRDVLKKRASSFSGRSKEAIGWIDETVAFWQGASSR